MSINTITILGRLTRAPELKYTQSNMAVCSFSVAVDRPGVKDKTDFISVTAWDKRAEFVSRYFDKGAMIAVTGTLCSESWQNKEGKNQISWSIRADNISFAGKDRTDNVPGEEHRPMSGAQSNSDTSDDELPF